MKIHTHLTNLLTMLVAFLAMASCDYMPSILGDDYEEVDSTYARITDIRFSEDYRYIDLKIDFQSFDSRLRLEDTSTCKLKVRELEGSLRPVSRRLTPVVDSIDNIGAREVKKSGIEMLVLIDLTQPNKLIVEQHDFVKSLEPLFADRNLYLAFMLPEGGLSPMMCATPYVIDNYITPTSPLLENIKKQDGALPFPYLYRSLVTTLGGYLSGHSGTPIDNADKKVLIVMTDGKVYNDVEDIPLDPEHYQMQQRLIKISQIFSDNLRVYCINMASDDAATATTDNNMLKLICQRSKGIYTNEMSETMIMTSICDTYNVKFVDYSIRLINPSHKVYYGNDRTLILDITTPKDSLLTSCRTQFDIGTIYSPVCIDYDLSYLLFVIQGIIIGLIILILTYHVMQVIIPYVKYRIFHRRCVTKYRGPNMSFRSIAVPDTCYFCKAPFAKGDSIVVKCQHVVHEECWEENGQQCPEYGTSCNEGSYYYNWHNPFDIRNAHYSLKWIMVAIVAGMLSWLMYVGGEHRLVYGIIDKVLQFLINDPNDMSSSIIMSTNDLMDCLWISPRLYHLPVFAVYLTLILVMLTSVFVLHRRKWYLRLAEAVTRALAASVLVMIAFLVECVIVVSLQIYDGFFFVDWIPWSISTFIIAFSLSWHTRIRPRRKYVVFSLAVGFGSSFMWTIFSDVYTVYGILRLTVAFILYSVAVVIVVMRQLPKYEHYILHVSGEIKEMDIALYKWLRQSANASVTIGRSIDCSLQMSWDIRSDISPIHARIIKKNGIPCLVPYDGIVMLNDKEMKENKPVRLYHGDVFQIGSTSFKFIEK